MSNIIKAAPLANWMFHAEKSYSKNVDQAPWLRKTYLWLSAVTTGPKVLWVHWIRQLELPLRAYPVGGACSFLASSGLMSLLPLKSRQWHWDKSKSATFKWMKNKSTPSLHRDARPPPAQDHRLSAGHAPFEHLKSGTWYTGAAWDHKPWHHEITYDTNQTNTTGDRPG